MTRYTFLLLVCRVIGVLSAVYFLTHLVYGFEDVEWAVWARGDGMKALSTLPLGMVAAALAVPLVGIIGGVYGERIAKAVAPQEPAGQPAPILTALAIPAVVCAFHCLALTGDAQLQAIISWRYSPLSDQSNLVRALHGGTGFWTLELAAAFAICLVAILFVALRATREVIPK
ncbi:MAG: hypothetical protein ACYC96_04140 [Fimbriimonadaceae bacterium]